MLFLFLLMEIAVALYGTPILLHNLMLNRFYLAIECNYALYDHNFFAWICLIDLFNWMDDFMRSSYNFEFLGVRSL